MKNTFYLFAFAFLFCTGCAKDCPDCGPHGTCQDGKCLCDDHYTGVHCDQQIAPVLIKIGSVTVTMMPATDANGAGWDLTSGPDLYFVIVQNGNTIISTHDQWKQNAGVGASWTINQDVINANAPITIQLWDFDDFDPHDFMGAVTFFLYSDTTGFPTTITPICPTCTVNFRIDGLEYL